MKQVTTGGIRIHSIQASPQAAAQPVDSIANNFSIGGRVLRGMQPAKKVAYEITDDVGYIYQYRLLRNDLFLSGMRPEATEEAADTNSQFLIARRGLQCFAGGRITMSVPSRRQKLPLEQNGLSLAELFPDLKLSQHSYAEFSRFAIMPEFRESEALPEITRSLIRAAIADGIEYLFITAPIALAYDFHKVAQTMGVHSDIRGDIKIAPREVEEGAHLTLSVMDLTPLMPDSVRVVDSKVAAG